MPSWRSSAVARPFTLTFAIWAGKYGCEPRDENTTLAEEYAGEETLRAGRRISWHRPEHLQPRVGAWHERELQRGRNARAVSPVDHTHRSEEHTSELQSLAYLVCRLLLEKKKKKSCVVVPAMRAYET